MSDRTNGRWRAVVTGPDHIVKGHPAWRIQAYAKVWDPTLVRAYVGQINSNTIFYGHGPPRTIMFMGATARAPITSDSDTSFWEVNLLFDQDSTEFDLTVQSGRFERTVNDNGIAVDAMIDSASRTIRSGGVDFTVFQNMLDL